MQILFEANGTTLIARFQGELDHHSAAEVREKVDLKLTSGIYHCLVFDFEKLSFMDSSGIGVIMGRVKNMALMGGKVIVANPNPTVERMLHIGQLETYISIQGGVK